jgi:hypothetical protein
MNDNKYLTFISYPRGDAEFALQLARDLKSAGFQIWLDQLDIPAGSRWDSEVQIALAKCAIFMVILTPEAMDSQTVNDEIGYAIDSGKRILPVLLQPCNIPFRLRRFQYADFTALDYDLGVETVSKLLRSLVNEATTPKRPAFHAQEVAPQQPASIERESIFRRILNRLAGDSTTDAPPAPKKKKDK